MVMSAFAVSVPVGNLFSGSVPDAHDFHIEYQVFTGQGVIAVELHGLSENFHHAEQQDFTLGSIGLKLIAFLEVFGGRELVFRDLDYQLFVESSISVRCGDFDLPLVADIQQRHGALEAGNDLAHTFQVCERRLGITGSVDHLT